MTVIILIVVSFIINGIVVGYLFINLKADVMALQLMNKLYKEDQKKYLQDFQLKLTDKIALLDAKLTRILTEIADARTIAQEVPCPEQEKAIQKYTSRKRRGKVPLHKTKQPKAPVDETQASPQT